MIHSSLKKNLGNQSKNDIFLSTPFGHYVIKRTKGFYDDFLQVSTVCKKSVIFVPVALLQSMF